MRGLIYLLLDKLTDWLVDLMIWMEPKKPRKQELDYTMCKLPDEILAIIRTTWYKDGKPDEVDEIVLLKDGQNGYDAFAAVVRSALTRGANVSIRSQYKPEQLGIIS
jgi:hypothetical protein